MPDDQPEPCPLTARQLEVVQRAAAGGTTATIGRHLFVSESTVKTHLNEARSRTHAINTTMLVAQCLRAGWIK